MFTLGWGGLCLGAFVLFMLVCGILIIREFLCDQSDYNGDNVSITSCNYDPNARVYKINFEEEGGTCTSVQVVREETANEEGFAKTGTSCWMFIIDTENRVIDHLQHDQSAHFRTDKAWVSMKNQIEKFFRNHPHFK